MLNGIDVSSCNGHINWNQVRKAKQDFAILRCHQLYGADETFERNYRRCRAREIPVGVYKCGYATNTEQARQEARDVLKAIKGKTIIYPVFYDIEVDKLVSLGSAMVEKIALAFLETVKAAGYKVGIYCNLDCYKNLLTPALRRFDCWVASYPHEDDGQIVERIRPPKGVVGWQYTEHGTVPGVDGTVDRNIFFKDYTAPDEDPGEPDEKKDPREDPGDPDGITAHDILTIARSWLGCNESDYSHREIVDLYNSHKPLAQGYEVSYTDSWCDAFVSACFIRAGATELIGGTECGVERHIQLFKAAGIWIEDGTITPEPGDIICFNWDQASQSNDGFADHIGLVESVTGRTITTIEGNFNNAVQRRDIPVGWGYIRGYARPRYAQSLPWVTPEGRKDLETVVDEVLAGKWGNGEERFLALTRAGYDAKMVQDQVDVVKRRDKDQ